jgi:hypothetical protein
MTTTAFNNDSYCNYEQCSNDASKYPNFKLINQENSKECYQKELCNKNKNTTLLSELQSRHLFTNSNIRHEDARNQFDYSVLSTGNLTIGIIVVASMIYYNFII